MTPRGRFSGRRGAPSSLLRALAAAALAPWLLVTPAAGFSPGAAPGLSCATRRGATAAATTTTAVAVTDAPGAQFVATGDGKSPDGRHGQQSNGASSARRSYSAMTTDELHELTLHHLSQNLRPDNADAAGDLAPGAGALSPAQLHALTGLLVAWAKRDPPRREDRLTAAEMAEQCLRELSAEVRAGSVAAARILSVDLHRLVLRAWRRAGGRRELVHATGLLDLLEENLTVAAELRGDVVDSHNNRNNLLDNNGNSAFKCYVTVLDGWCKSKSGDAPRRAERLLHRVASMAVTHDDGIALVRQYNNVMNRIAQGGGPTAGREAERLLRELIEAYKAGARDGTAAPPTRGSFNVAIKAYARGGGKDAAKGAGRVLTLMEDPAGTLGLDDGGGEAADISPDRYTYATVLAAWAAAAGRRGRGGRGSGGDATAGERAEALLVRMRESGVVPDTVAYNAVLKVWGTCDHPDAGERSEILLNKMIQLYQESGDSNILPDQITFNTVIHNIANSDSFDAPPRAMHLLEHMESMHESGMIYDKPDIISYNSVLDAFAKSGGPESAWQAEELLNKLEEMALHHDNDSPDSNPSPQNTVIRPDVYSYNIVISAWGNCGRAEKAVALLDRMTAFANDGRLDLRPDATTYNTLLNAWSQSSDRNAPVKALGLLEIMLRIREGGDHSADPTALSFSTVINAFSKSRFPRKARQARDLLLRMKRLHEQDEEERMRPNVYVYSAVLNACAYTFGRAEEKEEALKVGIETYEEMQNSGIKPNHVAYGSFIRLCRRLVSEDDRRNQLVRQTFEQCCSDGQLGEYVLRQLRAVPGMYYSLLREYMVDDSGEVLYQDLPLSWTCNVKDRRKKNNHRQFGKGSTKYECASF